ncbi:MAG: CPBP family glutamic-type intramembrane protease [Nitrospira sp.]|nr:CPBP family glutamic-type intramembrane protease [Nitrospira sp.]MDH5347187.1 CPBP family glutamic-type intramembrane protease [Nitrospira sp.]MDH5499354.1 CPBP family glutamic-type intramembrane protease [Nitrospira sp.]
MASGPDQLAPHHASNMGAALALLPIGTTFGYYVLPISLQEQLLVQFAPQLLTYMGLGLWATRVSQVPVQLGLERGKIWNGFRWGAMTGLLLGALNTFIILAVYPTLGYDITFLKHTPHGRLPILHMVPWVICGIALFVELNFRGFLLGRLAELESHWRGAASSRRVAPLALAVSALTFTFDPFLVKTFQHLHWIALWDGLIWGIIWLCTRNLYITIVAHAIEVMVMYSVVRTAIG